MLERPKVAVIGAGALGLMALKNLVEDGFDATGFEARPYVGGLWKDTDDASLSVHATTIFNTSKFRAAISDFPFPEDVDIYPTAAQLHKYLCDYADHFDLRRRIHLGCRVSNIRRQGNEWEILATDVKSGEETVRWFHRVCVATGSFHTPRWPRLEGIEKFGGTVLHSIDFHGSEPFKDQNVLIIGMHASAQDVTNALSDSARKVYLSHRHGLLLLPRFNEAGMPFDVTMKLPVVMLQGFMESHAPKVWAWLFDRIARFISDKTFGDTPASWGLHPRPSMAVSTPLLADTIWPFLKSGFAEPVPAVKEFTGPSTVVLTNGRVLEDINTVLYCTGYETNIPDDLIPKPIKSYAPYPNGPGKPPHLFKNMFPMCSDTSIQTSLAFLGHGATFYPGFLQFELQGMAVSQVWRGTRKLPPQQEMLDWHAAHIAQRAEMIRRYNVPKDGSTFYEAILPFADYFPWLNDMAGTGIFETFGGKLNGLFNPNSWKLWREDRELYKLCTKKFLSPAVYRALDVGGRKALDRNEVKRILRRDSEILERAVKSKQSRPSVYTKMKNA